MVTETEIRAAYIFLRQYNSTLSDEVLGFIKDAALEKLEDLKRPCDHSKYKHIDQGPYRASYCSNCGEEL